MSYDLNQADYKDAAKKAFAYLLSLIPDLQLENVVDGTATETADNSLRNAFQALNSEFYAIARTSGDKLTLLAKLRIKCMEYPNFNHAEAHNKHAPRRAMVERLGFDRVLFEIGGWELMTDVIKKVAEIKEREFCGIG